MAGAQPELPSTHARSARPPAAGRRAPAAPRASSAARAASPPPLPVRAAEAGRFPAETRRREAFRPQPLAWFWFISSYQRGAGRQR